MSQSINHLAISDFRPKYFERYGRKRGFTLYVLRYFLWTNVGAGLHVTQPEFMALVSAVLGRVDSAWYQRLAVQPTLRAVTMGNWFQVTVAMVTAHFHIVFCCFACVIVCLYCLGVGRSSCGRTLCCKGLDLHTWWIDPAWLKHLQFGLWESACKRSLAAYRKEYPMW